MSASGVRAGRAYVEVGLESQVRRDARKVQRELKAVSGALRGVGTGAISAAAGVATPVITGLAGLGAVFGSFSHRMSEVRAITGATREDFESLTMKAKELGRTTRFSARQSAEAMKFLGMAGFNTQEILAGVGPVLELAAAGGLDLATAADIASDVGSAFGITAENISRVADVMAATATSSNTSVEMLGESFRYAAPLAAAAGQSIEEVSAALGTLANSGIKATVAGTDVAGILKTIAEKPEALNRLGISVKDAEGNVRSITDIMRDFGAATDKLTQAQRLRAATSIFGRYAKSALVLSSNIPGLEELKTKLDDSAGAAAEMAEIMSDDLWGSFMGAASAAEGLVIALGSGGDGIFRSLLDGTAKVLRSITAFLEENQHVATALVAVGTVAAGASLAVAGLGVAFVALGAVASGVSAIAGLISMLAGVPIIVVGVGAAVVGVTAYLGTLTAGLGFVLHESGLLGDALTFLKSKLVPFGVIASKTFGGIKRALQAGEYVLAAKVLWAGLKLVFAEGIAALGHGIMKLWENASDITARFFASLAQTAYNVFASLPRLLWSALSGGAKLTEIIARALVFDLGPAGDLFDVSSARKELASLLNETQRLKLAQEQEGEDEKDNQDGPGSKAGSASIASVNAEAIQAAEDRIAALRDEITTMRLGADAAERLKLKQKGATDAQLEAIKALQDRRREIEREKEQEEETKRLREQRLQDLREEGKRLAESLRTDREILQDALEGNKRLFEAGVIDAKVRDRADRQAFEEFAQSNGAEGRNTVAEFGSQAALDTLRRSFGVESSRDWAGRLVSSAQQQLTATMDSTKAINRLSEKAFNTTRLEQIGTEQVETLGQVVTAVRRVELAVQEEGQVFTIPD